jgi:protoporphyrinogen/coproporphyrinogen III oxidase
MKNKQIVILGAGISGLSLAWFLKRKFGHEIDLTVVEKNSRPGGLIKTLHKENFLFELGCRSWRLQGSGQETLKLIDELDLQDQVISCDVSAYRRFLYLDQKLQPLPSSLFSFLSSPLRKGVLKACFKDLMTPKGTSDDESIFDFIARRFGAEMAQRFIDPLVKGIYAGDIRQLSMKSCFPSIYRWEQERGSVLKGAFFQKKPDIQKQPENKGKLFSFKKGMQTLTDALASKLEEHLLFSSAVKKIHILESRAELILENNTLLHADHLYATIPSYELATLIPTVPVIPTTSITVVSLGYRKNVLKQSGFGYLIPSSEQEKILGVVWDSSVFPQQNQHPEETRLTVMLHAEQGGLEIALDAISRHLGIEDKPDVWHVYCARQAIPQYLVGHDLLLKTLNNSLPPHVTVLGSSFYGVSVNDCIKNAKKFV